jgi:hypothetical protein
MTTPTHCKLIKDEISKLSREQANDVILGLTTILSTSPATYANAMLVATVSPDVYPPEILAAMMITREFMTNTGEILVRYEREKN